MEEKIGVSSTVDVPTKWSDLYEEKDLVSFGNYLLSKQRKNSIINKDNLDKVTHADIENWKQQNVKNNE